MTINTSHSVTTTAGMNITETVTLNKPVSADLQSMPATVRHNTNNLKSQSLWARITNPRYRVKVAVFSVINAVREKQDYSNGATYWDGPDVMTGNFAGNYDPLKHFRQKPLNGDDYRVQGIFDPKNLSLKFYKNAKSYYSKYDTHRAPYLKELNKFSTSEHYDIATIDPLDKQMKLKAIDSSKDISFNKSNTLLEGIGTGAFKVTIKCLWEIRMQSACSVFYKQLNKKY